MATRGSEILQAAQRGRELRRRAANEQERLKNEQERIALEEKRFNQMVQRTERVAAAQEEANILKIKSDTAEQKRLAAAALFDAIQEGRVLEGERKKGIETPRGRFGVPGTDKPQTDQTLTFQTDTGNQQISRQQLESLLAGTRRAEERSGDIELRQKEKELEAINVDARITDKRDEERDIRKEGRALQNSKDLERFKTGQRIRADKAKPDAFFKDPSGHLNAASSSMFGQIDLPTTKAGLQIRTLIPEVAAKEFPFLTQDQVEKFREIPTKSAKRTTAMNGVVDAINRMRRLKPLLKENLPEAAVQKFIEGGKALFGQSKFTIEFEPLAAEAFGLARGLGEVGRLSDTDIRLAMMAAIRPGITQEQADARIQNLQDRFKKSMDLELRGVPKLQRLLSFPQLYVDGEKARALVKGRPELDPYDPEVAYNLMLEGFKVPAID